MYSTKISKVRNPLQFPRQAAGKWGGVGDVGWGVGKSAEEPCVILFRAATKELLNLKVMYRFDRNVSFIAENTSSFYMYIPFGPSTVLKDSLNPVNS